MAEKTKKCIKCGSPCYKLLCRDCFEKKNYTGNMSHIRNIRKIQNYKGVKSNISVNEIMIIKDKIMEEIENG